MESECCLTSPRTFRKTGKSFHFSFLKKNKVLTFPSIKLQGRIAVGIGKLPRQC